MFQQIALYISSVLLALMPTTKFVEGVVGQPENFFPHRANTQIDRTISNLLYRSLFTYDADGNLVPDLAESWMISDEDLVYTIKLKPDQRWSDGQPITADDLIYTAFKSPDLQEVATDRVDDLTVRYILPNKFSPFLSLLTIGVMQDGSEESYNPLTPVSSGPFRVLSIQRNGPIVTQVVLVRLDSDAAIKKLIFKYYTLDDQVYEAAQLGEIHGFMTSQDYELENFNNYRFALQGVYFSLFFNTSEGSLQEVEFRESLAKSLDVEELIIDKGTLVEGPISRSPFTYYDVDFNLFDFAYSDDYDDTVTITVPDIETHRSLVEQVKASWESRLGVNVEVVYSDPETFVDDIIVPRNYEILLYGQEVSRDPDRYVNWHSTQMDHPGLNLSMFEQIRVDRALEEGRSEIDNSERQIHYNEFQRAISENVPAVFLYHPYRNYYVNSFVEGIDEKYTFTIADRFLDFGNWRFIRTN